jgi:putative transposase
LLDSVRLADLAPAQVHARLLDEGVYLCSVSTMYRILWANGEVRERRRLARHPEYRKPELLATAPRQLFSWDVNNIRGPHKGVWFSMLVMIDIFSRYIVGWMLVRRSDAVVAEHFIASVLKRENVRPGQAVVHAGRGSEMTAQAVCLLLDKLGVVRSHSRPHVSDHIRTRSRNLKRSNTARAFQIASVRSKTARHSLLRSSLRTTPTTGTPALPC